MDSPLLSQVSQSISDTVCMSRGRSDTYPSVSDEETVGEKRPAEEEDDNTINKTR